MVVHALLLLNRSGLDEAGGMFVLRMLELGQDRVSENLPTEQVHGSGVKFGRFRRGRIWIRNVSGMDGHLLGEFVAFAREFHAGGEVFAAAQFENVAGELAEALELGLGTGGRSIGHGLGQGEVADAQPAGQGVSDGFGVGMLEAGAIGGESVGEAGGVATHAPGAKAADFVFGEILF